MTKMTYVQAIDVALERLVEEDAEAREKLIALKEQLTKRGSTPKKPTKTQMENDGFKADIISYLATADAPATIKDIQANVFSVSTLSNQRMTHLLTDLVKNETLVKTYVKKTPYFAMA